MRRRPSHLNRYNLGVYHDLRLSLNNIWGWLCYYDIVSVYSFCWYNIVDVWAIDLIEGMKLFVVLFIISVGIKFNLILLLLFLKEFRASAAPAASTHFAEWDFVLFSNARTYWQHEDQRDYECNRDYDSKVGVIVGAIIIDSRVVGWNVDCSHVVVTVIVICWGHQYHSTWRIIRRVGIWRATSWVRWTAAAAATTTAAGASSSPTFRLDKSNEQ